MNRTELQPVELLILAALVLIEALMALVIAAAAVVLTLAQWRPAASPVEVLQPWSGRSTDSIPPPASPYQVRPLLGQLDTHPVPPARHPLALLAERLESLPVTRLRPMAGTRSKRARKAELIALVAACC